MDTLRQDLRHAFRLLVRSPGFTVAAVVTLALGIGANTTIFGFMNALLLRPFPVLDLDHLVSVWERHPQEGAPGGMRGGDQNPLAVADYLDLRAADVGIESIAAYRYRDFVVTDAGEPERIPGYLVTPGYFETLGLRPAMGRTFLAEEGTPGRDAVAVLGHGFWQRRFGGDPGVLSRAFVLGGRRHAVVGVLPPGVNFPPGMPDLFVPLAFSEAEKSERGRLSLLAVARLQHAGSRSARAALDTFSARLARAYPDTNTARTLFLVPLREMQTGFTAPFLLLFEGAAAFVLLIACANVAGLLIARGAGREREMALRAALGAGRGRIVRQLLTEGFVLSALGAAAALWLAQGGVDLIRASLPPDMVRWVVGWSEIRMDARTLAFTLGLTVATTVAFGLVPALRAARTDLAFALKAGGRGTSGPPRRRLRSALVALQVTLSLVLLAGAMLMTRGFLDLVDLYQGFDPDRVVTLRLKLPEWQYPEKEAVANFYEQVVRGLEKTPGVECAGLVSHPPADLGPIPRTSFLIEGRPLLRPQEKPSADLQTISAGYLSSLRVAVQRGRTLTDRDGTQGPPVALVSASLARRFWPGEDPVGRRIRIGDDEPWRTVVGVVEDVKQYWFDREPRPTLYVSFLQSPRRDMFLVVRSALDTAAVVSAARARVRDADPEQPVDEIRTMAAVVAESASIIRLAAALMAILGLVALLLAAVGLHGVMAEHVAHRTREIGIRMALGARGVDVLRLVVGQAARLAGVGLGLGLLGAVALGRLMASALFGIVRPDPAGLAVVTAILASVAFAAAWVPARRATRVDPLRALREE
jgi:putative ABC transport system permease protein